MKKLINQLLIEIANELDLTDDQKGYVEREYNSMVDWLNKNDSNLDNYDIQIYPQGSMRLGTAVRPVAKDDFDIDVVCKLNNAAQSFPPERIKKIVGSRLEGYQNEKRKLLPEKRRCWQIDYLDNINFHMDILPAVQATPSQLLLEARGFTDYRESTIRITERLDNRTYTSLFSNPVGYAEWFKNKMQIYNQTLYERGAIESIPDYPVKTTLQMTIQLLKRHRDIVFINDKDELASVSIIITTLAAKAFNHELEIVSAMATIVNNLALGIETKNGVRKVLNPVWPDENFADKWEKDNRKERAFFSWLSKIQADYQELLRLTDIKSVVNKLYLMFSQKTVDRAINNFDGFDKLTEYLQQDNLPSFFAGKLIDISHRMKPPWVLPPGIRIGIKAEIYNGDTYLCSYTNNGTPIDKSRTIKFYPLIPFPSIKEPYRVKWQITNTGAEAKIQECLRGNLFENSDLEKNGKLETTAYTGSHIVQCFVIKNNQCVGKSGEFIVNIK